MSIVNLSLFSSNLSQTDVSKLWNAAPQENEFKLQSDYTARGQDTELLLENDIELQRQIDDLQSQIDGLDVRLTIVEGQIVALDARVTQNEGDIADNAANIATNTANIATNTANIATNTSAIADINDGRYQPQYGSGSPEGVVTANLNGSYYDLSVPSHWQNSTSGSDTGWVQIV